MGVPVAWDTLVEQATGAPLEIAAFVRTVTV